MSDTRTVLTKIAALRQRLEQTPGLVRPGCPEGEALDGPARLRLLEEHVAEGKRHTRLLDEALRKLAGTPAAEPGLPTHLTARARGLLQQGHQLLGQLKALASDLDLSAETDGAADPLIAHYRATVAMADTALRLVQAYPDAPSAQLRLCDGLESTLEVVAQRVATLRSLVDQRRQKADRVDMLADLLTCLAAGQPVELKPFVTLAQAILSEARQGTPLRFLQAVDFGVPDFDYATPTNRPLTASAELKTRQTARFIACHSLTTAQVMARLVGFDPILRSQPEDAVLAALVHDVGMLHVPAVILAQPGQLDDEQRRAIESHARSGAECAARLLPGAAWLFEATAAHHERLDGTGYPGGLTDLQIAPLTRLLGVCDVYAAQCVARPHRAAREPRTALADTLLLADRGGLDRTCAEHLLHFSFYPVGSVVAFADGSVGVVLATHPAHTDVKMPSRPVLMMLSDAQGQLLPVPRVIDLAEHEERIIVRSLTVSERRRLLGTRNPELA